MDLVHMNYKKKSKFTASSQMKMPWAGVLNWIRTLSYIL